MSLLEDILKLPECKLYGIMNCKNKQVLLTKNEVISKDKIKTKIEETKYKMIVHPDTRQAVIDVLQELLNKQ